MSYQEYLIDFSLDDNAENHWRFHHYSYISDPRYSKNTNPEWLSRYFEMGLGGCHCCGHSPIVNHYFMENTKTGEIKPVGSECFPKILKMRVSKAIKYTVDKVTRNHRNKLKLKYLLEQYQAWFDENPDVLDLAVGYWEDSYAIDYGLCPYEHVRIFIEKHKGCSDFFKKLSEESRLSDRVQQTIFANGCFKCREEYYDWQRENIDNKDVRIPCQSVKDFPVRVGDMSEVPKVSGCKNSKQCRIQSPYTFTMTGRHILRKVETAYEKNYKDIKFIFLDISMFNKFKVKVSENVFEGEHKEIPVFKVRDLKKMPQTEEEHQELEEKINDALSKLKEVKE